MRAVKYAMFSTHIMEIEFCPVLDDKYKTIKIILKKSMFLCTEICIFWTDMNKIKKIVLLFGLIFIIHEIAIISDGLIDDNNLKADVAVIFGSKVNTDGSLSARLKARLDRGIKLYADSIVNELYVSGGLGKEGFYEGTVMKDYLIANNIPENSIKVDNQGINTRNTALNFKKDYPSASKAIVVSQFFHVNRCKLAFRQVGIKKVKGVHCNYYEFRDIYATFREFFGFYKYVIYYS